MKFEKQNLFWIREAEKNVVTDDKIIIYTRPETDLWQRTYYGFQNDSAPVPQMKIQIMGIQTGLRQNIINNFLKDLTRNILHCHLFKTFFCKQRTCTFL